MKETESPQTPLVELLIDDRVPLHAIEKYLTLLDYLVRLHGGEGICVAQVDDAEPE